jgi:hypothetical protein
MTGDNRTDEPNEQPSVTLVSPPPYEMNVMPAASGAVDIGLTTIRPAAPPTISVQKVLDNLVGGYLLGDLESMATEIPPKPVGAVGYPMVMSVLSGSELLGTLTSNAKQANRIEMYWGTFMAQIDPRYGDLGEIASEMARNGIAHSYLSHLGVLVVRGDAGRHLTLEGDEVVFDCLELYGHFRRSIEEHARPYILDHLDEAQRRLDSLLQNDEAKVRPRLGKLPAERFPRRLAPITTGTTSWSTVHSASTPFHVGRPTDIGQS